MNKDLIGNFFINEEISSNIIINSNGCVAEQKDNNKPSVLCLSNTDKNYSSIGLIDKTKTLFGFSTNSNNFEFGLYYSLDDNIEPIIRVKKTNNTIKFGFENYSVFREKMPIKTVANDITLNNYFIVISDKKVLFYENNDEYWIHTFSDIDKDFDLSVVNKQLVIKFENGNIFNIIGLQNNDIATANKALNKPNLFIKDFNK